MIFAEQEDNVRVSERNKRLERQITKRSRSKHQRGSAAEVVATTGVRLIAPSAEGRPRASRVAGQPRERWDVLGRWSYSTFSASPDHVVGGCSSLLLT